MEKKNGANQNMKIGFLVQLLIQNEEDFLKSIYFYLSLFFPRLIKFYQMLPFLKTYAEIKIYYLALYTRL